MTCFLFANRHLHITELILKKYVCIFYGNYFPLTQAKVSPFLFV
jgi:hypothetical protein